MKILILNTIIFLLPVCCILGIYEYFMFNLGETYSISRIFELQEKTNGLFMRKYLSQEFNLYKMYGIKRYNPEVLIIGSSRVMQFRGDYFRGKFYNAGGLIQNHKDLNNFLSSRINADFILIGIDSWWYKDDYVSSASSWIDENIQEKVLTNARYNSLRQSYNILLDNFSERVSNNIGANAQLNNSGFRLDGSLKIPDSRVNLLINRKMFIDTEEPPVYKRIQYGLTSKFTVSKVDTVELLHSIRLIKLLIEQGKEVIVYLPPFSSESYDLFNTTLPQSDFYQFTTDFIPTVLSKWGINYIINETPRDYCLDDTYFIDGFHPSEIFIALQVYRHNLLFNKWIDVSILKNKLNSRYCNILFSVDEMRWTPSSTSMLQKPYN